MHCYRIAILAILIGSYLLELLVEKLNLRSMTTELPEEFAATTTRTGTGNPKDTSSRTPASASFTAPS